MTAPLQAVDLTPLLYALALMGGLVALHVVVVLASLPRRVRKLRGRVRELEERIDDLEAADDR